MRIIVTGATSMVGVALIKECVKNGNYVLAIVRRESTRINRLPDNRLLKIRYLDMDEYESLEKESGSYDVFYHLAWKYTNKEFRNDPLLQQENIKSTIIAAKVAKKLGCNLFIGAGSQAEYGIVNGRINEKSMCNPISAYGMAKLSAYMLSREYCFQNDIKHIWGRIFSVYGNNDNEGTMINYAIDNLIKDKMSYFSQATNIWNYLYEEDCGKMLYLLGEKNVAGGLYCIANQESKILKEYIMDIEKQCDKEGKCRFCRNIPTSLVNLDVDISKFISEVQYIPETDFSCGINRILRKKQL